MSRHFVLAFFLHCCVVLVPVSESNADTADDAKQILSQADFSGGFIVHLDAGDGRLTAALRQNDSTQVHGLVRGDGDIEPIRDRIRSEGHYGDVAIDRLEGTELPYVDNLVNLLVTDSLGDVSMEEVQRVLVPNGIALIKRDGQWTKVVKPRPDNIDDWSHYLHDASGNSVARDDVVAPPRHLQWVGSPRWSRHHDRMASMSALVSSGGRMFYIMDEGSRISIQLPPKWKLIARDAFNGSILWKKDIAEWQPHLWPLKSGPTQLSRRLVSTDKEVFVTLGFNAPLTALDTATGDVLRTYEGSDATEEIISTDGLLFLVVRKGKAELADYAPLHPTVGDQARSRDFFWNEEPRVLMAYEASTGKQLWAKQTKISPLTMAAAQSQLYFHDGEKIVSLDGRTGDVVWESESVTRRDSFTFNFGPRLVVYEDVVLYSGGDGKMISSDAKSGEKLWDASFPNSGYQSPQDLMVVNGLVWLAPLTSGKDSGVYTGRNPRTGEVVKQFAPDVDTYWFHHRCYIAKATDNFLMPSRTGIEFVDPEKEHWDIHHWVRGGCLYGVMPCNGLTYAPPHNCACYPEAKLFGFNALAPLAPTRPIPAAVPEEGRLEIGQAINSPLTSVEDAEASAVDDWPTYRHDGGRSGTAGAPIDADVKSKWTVTLGGRLTSPVIADGLVYVAQIDEHTLHALDEQTGQSKWTFTAGARIDSPPTVYRGRVIFGGADGWVYCLNTNGKLAWRYRAAPIDRRAMAYEQLESLWPVHGSVLMHDDTVYCVAGRSNFLDGGLRLLRLDLATGKKLSETIMDETNPETGNNMQEKLQILQMPVGLPDILSTDGRFIFMKSQKFDFEGNRLEIGPNSGDFAQQASKQRGPDAHIFAPMGFLDDTWFHRSYWVLGQSFAGGHGGYYQAGRFAPSGRILVKGNGYVYGYGRKPQYLRWTTVLEHQLFAAEQNPPEIPKDFGNKGGGNASVGAPSASFPKSPSLNPQGKPITVEAWVSATKPQGVVIARGGPTAGFALTLQNGKPQFMVRNNSELATVEGPKRIVGGWHHLVGVLNEDKTMQLYVDGQLAGSGVANGLLSTDPVQGLDVGADGQSAVGEYKSPMPFSGAIDEVRLYFLAANAEQIAKRYNDGSEISSEAVLAVSFDDGTARDHSLHRNNGTLEGGKLIDGKFGKAVQFSARNVAANNKPAAKKPGANSTTKPGDSLVKPTWAQDVPIYVRGMVLAGHHLFIVGPPDTIDEEETFQKLSESDQEVQTLLDAQDAALMGQDGASLLAVNIDTGEVEHEVKLDSLPAWDGLAGANECLFLSTLDGSVMCFGK
ncbi:outer membrane protein assembly factor BamB family protein [Stieleria varia]|uniref:Outer membrane biogenesis protein BamB n=1 Tax=Stieleria varia TaxID=2528005 RepID=A0A5C6B5A3_9BACT|nr:PQQ-binding-like beta-propeller repeat protein [Stieleria varia]TWU06489.1 outer membrane biogenesis protein BamB [Stieleria varia]